jgi:hypothetical protein
MQKKGMQLTVTDSFIENDLLIKVKQANIQDLLNKQMNYLLKMINRLLENILCYGIFTVENIDLNILFYRNYIKKKYLIINSYN